MYISLVNKFADQAGIVPVAIHTNPLIVSYHMNHETMVKFAELIVRECANLIDKDEMELTLTERTIHNTIKEHFGVEE